MGLLSSIGQAVGLLPGNPATQQPGTPPTAPQHGWLLNALDNGLLAHGISSSDQQRLSAQMAQYQYQQNAAFAETLPKELQAQFWADPVGVRGALEKGLEPITQKPDETTNYGGPTGPRVTAPAFDPLSGHGYQLGQGGSIASAGAGLGGDYKAENGVVASGRTGDIANRFSLPQVLGPGAHIGDFTPGIAPPGIGPQAGPPPGGMAPPPLGMGVPSLAQIPEMFPGASVTSGLRSPMHNAAVGGVPNSWHMQGTADAPGAIDLTPPPGIGVPAFTGQVAGTLPDARVIGEGDHIHIQPNRKSTGRPPLPAALQQPGGTPSIIDQGPQTPLYSPPVFNPKTNQMEQVNNATGRVESAGAGSFNPQSAKADLAKSEPVLNYTSAMDAYKAMLAAANMPNGGMRAYALRDTFARLINPGAVARVGTIQAIEHAQGVPANIKAWLMNLKGDGNVPPEIAQQILDVSHGFLAGHHASAKALNDSYAQQATRAQLDPRDATVPVEDVPGFAHLSLPPKDKLTAGDIYKTSRGMAVWNGQGFMPYGQ